MNCPVCSAPALPIDEACVFCHAPLVERDEPLELLDYLTERLPIAHAKRGPLNRGPITEVAIDVDGRSFRAKVKNEALELAPPVEVAVVGQVERGVGAEEAREVGVFGPAGNQRRAVAAQSPYLVLA